MFRGPGGIRDVDLGALWTALGTAQFTASGDFDGEGKDDLLLNQYNAGGDTLWWGSTETDFSTTPDRVRSC